VDELKAPLYKGMGCAACLATTEQVKAILDARGVKENESCDTQQIAVDLEGLCKEKSARECALNRQCGLSIVGASVIKEAFGLLDAETMGGLARTPLDKIKMLSDGTGIVSCNTSQHWLPESGATDDLEQWKSYIADQLLEMCTKVTGSNELQPFVSGEPAAFSSAQQRKVCWKIGACSKYPAQLDSSNPWMQRRFWDPDTEAKMQAAKEEAESKTDLMTRISLMKMEMRKRVEEAAEEAAVEQAMEAGNALSDGQTGEDKPQKRKLDEATRKRYADLKALRARRQAEESEEPAARQQKHARKKADRSDKKKGTLTSMDDLGEMIAQAVKEKEEREAGEAGTPAEAGTADAGVAAAEIDPNESLKETRRRLKREEKEKKGRGDKREKRDQETDEARQARKEGRKKEKAERKAKKESQRNASQRDEDTKSEL